MWTPSPGVSDWSFNSALEVGCFRIADDLPRVIGFLQKSTHKVVEADFVRSRHLDNPVDRLCERGIADRTGDVIRRDGLEERR